MKLETKTKITLLRVVKSAWSQQKGPNGCRCEHRSGSKLEYWVRQVRHVCLLIRVSEPWHASVWVFWNCVRYFASAQPRVARLGIRITFGELGEEGQRAVGKECSVDWDFAFPLTAGLRRSDTAECVYARRSYRCEVGLCAWATLSLYTSSISRFRIMCLHQKKEVLTVG